MCDITSKEKAKILDLAIGLNFLINNKNIEYSDLLKFMNGEPLDKEKLNEIYKSFLKYLRDFIEDIGDMYVFSKHSFFYPDLSKIRNKNYDLYEIFNNSDGIFNILKEFSDWNLIYYKSITKERIEFITRLANFFSRVGYMSSVSPSYYTISSCTTYEIFSEFEAELYLRLKFKKQKPSKNENFQLLRKINKSHYIGRDKNYCIITTDYTEQEIDEVFNLVEKLFEETEILCTEMDSYEALNPHRHIKYRKPEYKDIARCNFNTLNWLKKMKLISSFGNTNFYFLKFLPLSNKYIQDVFDEQDFFMDVVKVLKTFSSNINIDVSEYTNKIEEYCTNTCLDEDLENKVIDNINLALERFSFVISQLVEINTNDVSPTEEQYAVKRWSFNIFKSKNYLNAVISVLLVSSVIAYKFGLFNHIFKKDDNATSEIDTDDSLSDAPAIEASEDLFVVSEALNYITYYKQPQNIEESINLAYEFVNIIQGDNKKYSKEDIAELVNFLNGMDYNITSSEARNALLDIINLSTIDVVNATIIGDNYSKVCRPFMMSAFFVDGTIGLQALQALDYSNNAMMFQVENINGYYWNNGIEDEIGLCIERDTCYGINFFDNSVPETVKLAYCSLAINYNAKASILYSDGATYTIPYKGIVYQVNEVFTPEPYERIMSEACEELNHSDKTF